MKRLSKITVSALIILVMLLSPMAAIFSSGATLIYSTARNSGERDVVAQTLDGTKAESYYTGSYSVDTLYAMSGSDLLSALRKLMTSTHSYKSSYSDCKNYSDETDCQNGDGTIILLYSSYVATQSDYINDRTNGWNREHVWPKNLGGFETTGAGADLHHIRPDDSQTNGDRSNRKYGNVNGGTASYTILTPTILSGYYNSSYFEPLDNVKGDVARICLYVYARWGAEFSKCSNITNVFQSVDVLLEWCEMDPVDTWEMGRNEVVAKIQGNRNVFIDYPELAWKLFDKDVPSDMVTPSGYAISGGDSSDTPSGGEPTNPPSGGDTPSGGEPTNPPAGGDTPSGGEPTNPPAGGDTPTPSGCEHKNTTTKNFSITTCGKDGYSGDIYCVDCKELVSSGKVNPATGNHSFSDWSDIYDEDEKTVIGEFRKCIVCSKLETNMFCTHEQTVTKNAADATCTKKGYSGDTYCVECDELISKGSETDKLTSHTFGEWTVIKAATEEGSGFERRTCASCGKDEVKTIPKIGADNSLGTIVIIAAASASAVAVISVVAVIIIKKRR